MAKLKCTHLCILLTLLLPTCLVSGQEKQVQEKRIVNILHSDLGFGEGGTRTLTGNVRLRHKEMFMNCDSAILTENSTIVKAYGSIHIFRGDTLHLYGEYLYYNSQSEQAEVKDSVILIDRDTKLYTNHIYYDLINETATYNTGGKIVNEDNVLTSIIGIYYSKPETAHFKDSVKLVNPDYTVTSDTLIYNTVTETAFFHGESEIFGDSLYARCEDGWYDTRMEVSVLKKNARIDNNKQIITGESLFYDELAGYGTAFQDVTINDKTQEVVIKGNSAWYTRDPEEFLITDSAQFIQTSEDDFIFLHADTLWSVTLPDTMLSPTASDPLALTETSDTILIAPTSERMMAPEVSDTIEDNRIMRAWYGVRIFGNTLQAICDSLSYNSADSIVKLYKSPVIWSDNNQLTADSIFMFITGESVGRIELYNSAFIIEKVDAERFNQIRGTNLTGYFRDNTIYKIEVKGNAENIYYLVDEGRLVGVNQGTSASIDIYLTDGKITDIYMFQSPDGTLDPPLQKPDSERRYDSFKWMEELRPKDRFDIFR
jgi:lipopolysaccharide export system protein LptA